MLALISIDELRLVIPQHQILTLEPVSDLDLADTANRSIGSIGTDIGAIPVFNLDTDFMVSSLTGDRRIVIALSNSPNSYAILADELNILEAENVTWKKLPRAIQSELSAVDQVAVVDGRLVCSTNSEMIYNKVLTELKRDTEEAA